MKNQKKVEKSSKRQIESKEIEENQNKENNIKGEIIQLDEKKNILIKILNIMKINLKV